jgi:serine/threonine-protein kinase
MRADGPLFRDIAAAIADGVSIDWDAAEMGTSDPGHRQLLDQLKVLQGIQVAGRQAAPTVLPDPTTVDDHPQGWANLEIVEEIGRGANGVVYRAWDPQLARQVALKLVPADESLESVGLEEGRLLARVRHPHVVTVYGAARSDGWVGLWMELIQGSTLEADLRAGVVFTIAEVLALGVDLCSALSAVHGAGLTHRDIKAQNIMRDESGRVVLMDFGTGRDRRTSSTEMVGTPLYMAPEVFRGEPDRVESDLYSLGVLLYRLITNRYPVEAGSLAAVREAHAQGRTVPLREVAPSVPDHVAVAIQRALDRDPSARYESAAVMEAALWASLREVVSQDLRACNAPRRLTPWLAGAGAVAALVALFAWSPWWTRDAQGGPASPLYLSSSGWLGIVDDGRLRIVATNPHEAYPLAVFPDGRVSTAGGYERTGGLEFVRVGAVLKPASWTPSLPGRRCCWFDGASAGRATYAVHRDVYGDGASEVQRFEARWSGGGVILRPGPGAYSGIAVAGDAIWLSTAEPGGGRLERWSNGRLIGQRHGFPRLVALAIDPADRSLWGVQEIDPLNRLTLVQFSADGVPRRTVLFDKPEAAFLPRGAEFKASPPE